MPTFDELMVQNFNIPVQVQPQVFGCLALVSWAQTLIYTKSDNLSFVHTPQVNSCIVAGNRGRHRF